MSENDDYLTSFPVKIGGVYPFRIVCQPHAGKYGTEYKINFGIYCLPHEKESSVRLVAEILVVDKDHVAACSVSCQLMFQEKIEFDLTSEDLNAMTEKYADWVQHLLWDSGAMILRSVTASIAPTMTIPMKTPDMHIIYVSTKNKDNESRKPSDS